MYRVHVVCTTGTGMYSTLYGVGTGSKIDTGSRYSTGSTGIQYRQSSIKWLDVLSSICKLNILLFVRLYSYCNLGLVLALSLTCLNSSKHRERCNDVLFPGNCTFTFTNYS
jgi:hypothetical protein